MAARYRADSIEEVPLGTLHLMLDNMSEVALQGYREQLKDPNSYDLCLRPFKLKKLQMWGKQISEGEIDFEWPTQEFLEKQAPNASLQSL